MSSSIYDPLSRVDLPPSRHAVESDSESDSDDGFDAEEPEAGESSPAPQLSFEPNAKLAAFQGQHTIVLLDQVGEAIGRQLPCFEQASVSWRQRQQGSFARGPEGWLYVLVCPASTLESRTDELSLFVRQLIAALSPSSLHVVSQYNPSLYIDSSPSGQSIDSTSEAPLRYMCTSVAGDVPALPASPFSAPNYLSGTAAALLQEAVYRSIPSAVVLAPSKVPKPRPHARLVSAPSAAAAKKKKGRATATALQEEFPSDDEDDDMALAAQFEEADPLPLNLDSDTGLDGDELFAQLNLTVTRLADLSGAVDGVPKNEQIIRRTAQSRSTLAANAAGLSAFVERRRREAIKRRRDLGGMYV